MVSGGQVGSSQRLLVVEAGYWLAVGQYCHS